MINMILKSSLIKNEIKHWLLILSLFLWAVVSTAFSISKKSEIVVIAIDHDGFARTINDKSDKYLKREMLGFVKAFLNDYYVYDQSSFLDNMNRATDMMSEDLWQRKREELLKIEADLRVNPLTQAAEIESIDLIEGGKIEVTLKLRIKTRLKELETKILVNLELRERARDSKHPWGYEVIEVRDDVI